MIKVQKIFESLHWIKYLNQEIDIAKAEHNARRACEASVLLRKLEIRCGVKPRTFRLN